MELARDANAKASDFEEIIRKDQALAVKVLKLVNSSFFGLRHKITSISQAVVLLGFKTIKSIVIAAKTSHLLNRQLAPYGYHPGGMWKHSISCAITCHFVATRASLDHGAREELFVAGLLHDVGKVVIAPHLAPLAKELPEAIERHGGDAIRAEKELLGVSHDEVGGIMAERWNLDPGLGGLIDRHHRADVGDSDTKSVKDLYALQLANNLCNQLGIGRSAGPCEPSPLFPHWLAELGLGEDGTLARDVEDWLDEMRSVFESIAADSKSING
jgi:HD-like signal output (HDOD) protein